MATLRVLFLVRRVGPYHDARFEAAGRRLQLAVVETRPASTEYPWTTAAGARHYRLDAFRPPPNPEQGWRGPELAAEIEFALQTHRPETVATAGWADPEYHVLLRRCHRLGLPAVVMSDSTFEDEPRRWGKEWLKRSVVRGYSAAVVAGTRSRDYLRRLGFPPAAMFQPWDVIDNRYFADGADHIRHAVANVPGGDDFPPRRFLCVARFIPKKNLERLVQAYAAYVAELGAAAWSLLVAGSGPLEQSLRAQVSSAGLDARVAFTGFRQYPELPECYAQAGALVLPSWSDQWGLVVNEAMAAGLPVLVSDRCGCAPDLVEDGVNGFRFDPHDTGSLKSALLRITELGPDQRREMGLRSRQIIAAYSPDSFAGALVEATAYAAGTRAEHKTPWLNRAVFRLLAARSGGYR